MRTTVSHELSFPCPIGVLFACTHFIRHHRPSCMVRFQFIKSFPDAYATDVGTGGLQLSGGQKQVLLTFTAGRREPHPLLGVCTLVGVFRGPLSLLTPVRFVACFRLAADGGVFSWCRENVAFEAGRPLLRFRCNADGKHNTCVGFFSRRRRGFLPAYLFPCALPACGP